MPYRLAQAVMPVVQHTYLEHMCGAPAAHALWQAALAGAFVGMGHPPTTAMRAAETVEMALGIREPAGYQRAELAALTRGIVHPALVPGVMEAPGIMGISPVAMGIAPGAMGITPGAMGVTPGMAGMVPGVVGVRPGVMGMLPGELAGAVPTAGRPAPLWEMNILDVDVDLD